jgi:two-component system, NtrC family, response regulator GlrR
MRTETLIWVIEELEGLTARMRSECPEFSVAAIAPKNIAASSQLPRLAVIDASEHLASASVRAMRSYHPAVPVLIVAPVSSAGCLAEDIDDFVIQPFRPGELKMRVTRLSGLKLERAGPDDDKSVAEIRARYRMDAVIGESAALHQAIRKVPRLGASEANVLVTGETGTGKELFARAIHYASARRAHPFVPINCAALPDTLFENELFGHEKGAYTDASSPGIGLLTVADGGSLFLDEVDSLSIASQSKLLRVLQEREYRPLGSQRPLRANVRIIAAANTPLAEKVAAHEFRADLFYRLNVLAIHLPSLAERREDIPILARHFVVRFAREMKSPPPKLSPDAYRCLMDYSWPGNIRELESMIQRAVVLADGPILDGSAFDLPGVSTPAQTLIDCSLPIKKAVYEFERGYLTGLLCQQEGNVTRAARAAGKDRRSFQRLLRSHGIASYSASPG